jgi:uncharacterized XkdX family phage protein
MFELWKAYYKFGWATQADLQKAVSLGLITQDEYNQIVGTA